MAGKLKTVRITLTPQIADLQEAFSKLDDSPTVKAPTNAAIAAEIRAWRAKR